MDHVNSHNFGFNVVILILTLVAKLQKILATSQPFFLRYRFSYSWGRSIYFIFIFWLVFIFDLWLHPILWASYVLLMRSNQRSSDFLFIYFCFLTQPRGGKLLKFTISSIQADVRLVDFKKKLNISFMDVCVAQPSLLLERVKSKIWSA